MLKRFLSLPPLQQPKILLGLRTVMTVPSPTIQTVVIAIGPARENADAVTAAVIDAEMQMEMRT